MSVHALARYRVRARLVPVALAVSLFATACGDGGFNGMYNMPLPGGADLGDNPYRITAQFSDVLDLVPQASVKVNDVAIGRVEKVRLAPDTKSAIVEMVVNSEVRLPANADAELRQSSLLGEKFVELRAPEGQPAGGTLAEGDVIPLARTSRNAELEEVFGALSLLLSGGGVEQLRGIAEELNDAFSGNEAEIRILLSRVDQLATELDGQKGQITKAIDSMNRLASAVVRDKKHLETGLEDLAPGVRVVAAQRKQIVGMLRALDELSDVTVDTIGRSRADLVANLRALEPTLRKLAEAGKELPESLKILPTYPLPWNAGDTMKGDFANVHARFDLNLDNLLENMTNTGTPIIPIPQDQGPGLPGPGDLPLPQIAPPLPGLPLEGSGGLLGSLLGGGR